MAEEKKILIPGRLKNIAVSSYLAGASDIIDDSLGKSQHEINTEVNEKVTAQSNNLLQEISNRISGDNVLQAQIDAGIRNADGLVFDIVPTKESANPVLSNGIYESKKEILESMIATRISSYNNNSWPTYDYSFTGLGIGDNLSPEATSDAFGKIYSGGSNLRMYIYSVTKGTIIHTTAGVLSSASSSYAYRLGFLPSLPSDVTSENLIGLTLDYVELYRASAGNDIDINILVPYNGYLVRCYYSPSNTWDSTKISCAIYPPLLIRDADEVPTSNSENLVMSGGVKSTIDNYSKALMNDFASIKTQKEISKSNTGYNHLYTDGSKNGTSISSEFRVYESNVTEHALYRIVSTLGSSANTTLFVFYDIDGNVLSYGPIGDGVDLKSYDVIVSAPTGSVLLAIEGNTGYTRTISALSAIGDGDTSEIDAFRRNIKAANIDIEGIVGMIPYSMKNIIERQSYIKANINQDGSIASVGSTSVRRVAEYSVSVGEKYIVSGNMGTTTKVLWAFYNDDSVVSVEVDRYTDNMNFERVLVVPSGANKLYLSGSSSNPPQCFTISDKEKTICPNLIYEMVTKESGFSTTNFGKRVLGTPRFIKIASESISFTSPVSCYIALRKYDSSYTAIRDSNTEELVQLNANEPLSFDVSNCAFIKYIVAADDSFTNDVPQIKVSVTGYFPEDWDTFNVRTSDGYQRIIIHPNVTNPTCCDEITDNVQDTQQLLTDFGVICLPDRYSNTGQPTRLIIYCHGGAVNYTSSVTRFDTVDLEPEYWLAEGYAIMDVEGNPFNNTDEHFHIPQAMDCYVAAYKWAIEHYNLRRDGVFLGGRSMGGGMTFNLLRAQCPIPVIAACANAAHGMCIGGTTPAGTENDRQQFYAEHCGFDIPEDFDWSTKYYIGNTYTEGSKKKLLYDNWNKLVKNTPIWSMCTDLPIDDESIRELVDNFYVAGSGHPSRRNELWGKLHAMSRCPVKIFGCFEDESCPPNDTALIYYRMLTNAAQIAEVRLFHSYKDYSGTGTTAHHYDTQDPALRANVTTVYGEELGNIPVVYVEMLQFWRRYEQEN